MSERTPSAGEEEPSNQEVALKKYQRQARGLLEAVLEKALPRGSLPIPPDFEQGRQTVELTHKKEQAWDSLGLIAHPSEDWPNPMEDIVVGTIQFCDSLLPTLDAIHEVDIIAQPSGVLEVVRSYIILDSAPEASQDTNERYIHRLSAQEIKEIKWKVEKGRPKDPGF